MKIETKIDGGTLRFRLNHPANKYDGFDTDYASLLNLALEYKKARRLDDSGIFTYQAEHDNNTYQQYFALNTCSCGVPGCGGYDEYNARVLPDVNGLSDTLELFYYKSVDTDEIESIEINGDELITAVLEVEPDLRAARGVANEVFSFEHYFDTPDDSEPPEGYFVDLAAKDIDVLLTKIEELKS